MVMRDCCGPCADAAAVKAATRMEAHAALRPHRELLPSPYWGGVGGGGRAVEAPSMPKAPPPSPTLPRKGGGSTPSKWRENAPSARREKLQLIIDHHAPGNPADWHGHDRLAALGIDDGDIIAEAV